MAIDSTFVAKFGKKITFPLFYQYIKAHKEYIFNKNIPHNSCLCEVCENASLLRKGLKRAITNGKEVPTNPHAIVKLYSCAGDKGCMMSECKRCKNRNLVVSDFVYENLLSDSSRSERENLVVELLRWSKDDGAAKVEVTLDWKMPLLHGKKP